MASSMTPYAGSIRLARRSKNSFAVWLEFARTIDAIRNPEITKNISTPMNPPDSQLSFMWKVNTESIAMALSPSISGL
jgi:hypothetical protein